MFGVLVVRLFMTEGARDYPLAWAEKAVDRAIVKVRGVVERAFGSMSRK